MKLTIVTAVRNVIAAGNRDALSRCIDSVTKLNTPHEHLIYDGASTDGTAEMLHELAPKIPTLKVVSESDTGIYNALNKGVRDAKGEWFYVLGCDDYLLIPGNMDRLLVEENCDEIVTPTVRYEGIRHVNIGSIFINVPYCHQGTIVKTDLLRSFGGFDEQYRICADYDFFLKLHKAAKTIRYRDTVFAYYDGRGVSGADANRTFEDFCRVAAAEFGTSPNAVKRMQKRGCPSLSVVAPFLFHKDLALRTAARCAAKSHIRRCLRFVFWPVALLRSCLKKTVALISRCKGVS